MGVGGFIARYKPDPQFTLDGPKKLLVRLILGAGLVMLVLPLVKTNPPVMGRDYWSVLDIVWQVDAGELHREAVPVYLGCACAMLLVCFVAALIPYVERALLVISVASALFCIRAINSDGNGFESMFYGNVPDGSAVSNRVRFGGLAFAIFAVMASVLYLLVTGAMAAGSVSGTGDEAGRG